MQGFIHLLLEAYVSETIGTQHLPQIRRMAGIQSPPLASKHYPAQMTTSLLQAIAEYESVLLDDLLYHFGRYFIRAPLMQQYYGAFFEGYESARTFLEQVPAIHRHLHQSLPEARFPDLRVTTHAPDLLEMVYASPRQLCRFLQGILDGVGQYFNEPLEIHEMECQHQGAPACRIYVRFLPVRRTGPQSAYPTLAGAPASRQQHYSGTLPRAVPEPMEEPAMPEDKRQREEEEDLLILQLLAARQTAALPSRSAQEQPLNLALSLFEIAKWLTARGVSAEQVRLSVIQRSLTRLATLGFVESKLDPQAVRQNASSGVAALSGQGILAAQRYTITPAGTAWLGNRQHHEQGH
jgi:predicted hydrocarbon binding protein